jgi:hypothetical protein
MKPRIASFGGRREYSKGAAYQFLMGNLCPGKLFTDHAEPNAGT